MQIVFLQGCNLAPKYQKPQAEISEDWSKNLINQDVLNFNQQQKEDFSQISWNNFFKNPELQNVIKIGLKNNRDLKIAALNIESAQSFYDIRKADLFPSIQGETLFSRRRITENSNNFGFSGRTIIQDQYYVGANFSYEVDFFGKARNLKKAALNDFLAKQETRNSLKISLISQISNSYLELANLKTQIENLQKIVEINEEIYQLKEKIFKKGLISQIELSETKSQVESLKSMKDVLNIDFEQNKNQLLLLINEKNDKNIKIINLEEIVICDKLPKNLSSEILLTRPDILQAENELIAKNANIGSARAAFFPSIYLVSSYGYSSAKFSTLFDRGSQGAWNYSPGLNIPIFEAGRNVVNLKISKIDKEIAIQNYQKAIGIAFKEVADELEAKKIIAQQLQSQKLIIEERQKIYELTNKKFNNGIDNYFTKAQSEIAFYQAKIDGDLVKKANFINNINLYKALGGGI